MLILCIEMLKERCCMNKRAEISAYTWIGWSQFANSTFFPTRPSFEKNLQLRCSEWLTSEYFRANLFHSIHPLDQITVPCPTTEVGDLSHVFVKHIHFTKIRDKVYRWFQTALIWEALLANSTDGSLKLLSYIIPRKNPSGMTGFEPLSSAPYIYVLAHGTTAVIENWDYIFNNKPAIRSGKTCFLDSYVCLWAIKQQL